jgi:hypothetical protein
MKRGSFILGGMASRTARLPDCTGRPLARVESGDSLEVEIGGLSEGGSADLRTSRVDFGQLWSV